LTNTFENPLQQKLWVLCIITEALKEYGVKPILIGGCALEYYTMGAHSTYDIDLAIINYEKLAHVMDLLGFQKEGRFWHHPHYEIVIEAPAEGLGNQMAPLTEVKINDYHCFIIGLEDLIIDRLNGYVHWKWKDDGRYVKMLLTTHFHEINWDYLKKRSEEELTIETLLTIIKELDK
jgi:hypothetical protein